MDWQKYPLIRLIIPFTLGMIGANLYILHMSVEVLFVFCCATLSTSFFLLKTSHTYRDCKFGVMAAALFFLIGMTLYTRKYQHVANSMPSSTTYCRGILAEPPKEKAHSWALQLEQENGTYILLYIGKNREEPQHDSITYASLQLGDTIAAFAKHITPTNHCKEDTFKAYNTYLFQHGVCATAYTPHNRWTLQPCKSQRNLYTSAKALQEQLHDIYSNHGISGEAGSIVEAMTIGRKTTLDKATRNAYANAGLSHILALSGFHVGIILLLIQVFFFKNILPLRWQWISNGLIIITLWGYALLTGLSPSLVRATSMFTILLLSQSYTQEALSSNTCALTFFLMLCINPFYLHDIGFLLSFIAVEAISLIGNRLITLSTSSRHSIPEHYRWLITLMAITLVCTISSAPLIAHHFGRFTFISILSNLILFPFVYLLMFASVLWWFFLWCAPINQFLTDILNWTATTMNTITTYISELPFATIEWHPGTFTTLLCYTALITFTYFLTHKKTAI